MEVGGDKERGGGVVDKTLKGEIGNVGNIGGGLHKIGGVGTLCQLWC